MSDAVDLATIRRRELAAARQRRYREREKCDELVLDVALKSDFITWALDHGYVDERHAWDRNLLADIARRIIETVMAGDRQ
jgi:hypothetical protein